MVFAPHPEDESLGCGGTILQKRCHGIPVDLVFMTDGHRSHGRLFGADRLVAIREKEALAAAEDLGCDSEAVHFLRYADGALSDSFDAAIEAVTALLIDRQPNDIFLPLANDGPSDHEVTFDIVIAALRRCGRPVRVHEYPIWFWARWPWVRLRIRPKRTGLRTWFEPNTAILGLPTMRRLTSAVFIGNLIDRKRAALFCHQSQVSSLNGDPDWPVLQDIAGGDFLDCFFHDVELFASWTYEPGSDHRSPLSQSDIASPQTTECHV
ncbi:PIG-L deacetylase family protein [Longibacter salinarum]|nr:PIG-L deacetylase family protein [Longibacter salinarum]